MRNGYEQFRVTGHVPPVTVGDVTVDVSEPLTRDQATLIGIMERATAIPGEAYTRMLVRNRLVMSDTRDEYRDHWAAISDAHGRVLVNGLGLGCYLKAILAKPDVTHVDVVEREPDVIRFFRERHPCAADPRVVVHQADAYEQMRAWPKGTSWDYAWHDIWPDKNTDDLEAHARLLRSYGRRVGGQGAWAHAELLALRRRDREWAWY